MAMILLKSEKLSLPPPHYNLTIVHCCHQGHLFPTSVTAPRSPDQLQRYQCNSIELTNAHSDPDVWQVAAHSCTFGADEQPTVPVCARYETLQTNLKINKK